LIPIHPRLRHGPPRCQSKRKHSGLTVSALATDDAEVCQCGYGSLGLINLENAHNGLKVPYAGRPAGSETDSSQNILFMDILVRLIRSDGVLKHALAVRDKEAPQSDKARGCRSGA
jgi:hypothetical protein